MWNYFKHDHRQRNKYFCHFILKSFPDAELYVFFLMEKKLEGYTDFYMINRYISTLNFIKCTSFVSSLIDFPLHSKILKMNYSPNCSELLKALNSFHKRREFQDSGEISIWIPGFHFFGVS